VIARLWQQSCRKELVASPLCSSVGEAAQQLHDLGWKKGSGVFSVGIIGPKRLPSPFVPQNKDSRPLFLALPPFARVLRTFDRLQDAGAFTGSFFYDYSVVKPKVFFSPDCSVLIPVLRTSNACRVDRL
jgi:hypothetical protein